MNYIEKMKIKNELVYKLRREIKITFFDLDYMKRYVDLTNRENLEFYNKLEKRSKELYLLAAALERDDCELSDKTIAAINNKIKERVINI